MLDFNDRQLDLLEKIAAGIDELVRRELRKKCNQNQNKPQLRVISGGLDKEV